MAVFLTDQMGIAAGAVSCLTLFVRIFDGINDPIIGSMADRSVDKGKGKYKGTSDLIRTTIKAPDVG